MVAGLPSVPPQSLIPLQAGGRTKDFKSYIITLYSYSICKTPSHGNQTKVSRYIPPLRLARRNRRNAIDNGLHLSHLVHVALPVATGPLALDASIDSLGRAYTARVVADLLLYSNIVGNST